VVLVFAVVGAAALIGGCAPLAGPSRTPSAAANAAAAPVAPARILDPTHGLPSQPSVRRYGPTGALELRRHRDMDPLRALVVEQIHRLTSEVGRPQPTDDPRLEAAADDLACALRGVDLPAFETVDFLLGHYGLVDAPPSLLLARASIGADDELVRQLAPQIRAALLAMSVGQAGVGVCRTSIEMALVVALQEKNVQLAPVSRTLAAGAAASIEGRLLRGHRKPEVFVTDPTGQTRELAAAPDASSTGFRAEVRCDRGAGRYQVEVMGEDRTGPAVVANFPLFCATAPPTQAPRPRPSPIGSSTAPEAEARMLGIVNQDRRSARLRPLTLDKRLADVARAHSQDMADHDFVGHVSPTTGNALDRVRRVGIQPTLLLENVGRAYSPEEAESGLMMSPGHRANLLDGRVTRIGIGIVFLKPVGGVSPLLVTQLFM
jgi:uncharacterized protein YkwD